MNIKQRFDNKNRCVNMKYVEKEEIRLWKGSYSFISS